MKKILLSILAFLLIPVLASGITLTADTFRVSSGLTLSGNTVIGTDLSFTASTDDVTFTSTLGNLFFESTLSNIEMTPGISIVLNKNVTVNTTTGALRLPRLTTIQRDAFTPLIGMIIFNTTTLQVEKYNGTSWVGATEADEWIELSDTPSTFTPDGHVKSNGAGTALEFGQAVNTTASVEFEEIRINQDRGSSKIVLQSNVGADQFVFDGLFSGVSTIATTGALDITSVGDISFNTNDLFIDTSASRVGVNQLLPIAELHVGSGTGISGWFNGVSEDGVLIDTNTNVGQLAIVGQTTAELFLHDNTAVLDQGMFRIKNTDETVSFQILDDAFTVVERTLMAFDNSNGFVGLNTLNPLALLNPLSTTEQLRLSYDVTNYASFTVGSTGDLTLVPTGGDLLLHDGLGGTNNTIDFGNKFGNAALLLFNNGAGTRFGWGLQAGNMQFFQSAPNQVWTWGLGGDLQTTGTNEIMRLTGMGELAVGTILPLATFHGVAVTEQLRLGFSDSIYTSFTVSSIGDLTLAPTGGDTFITGDLEITGTLDVESQTINFGDSTDAGARFINFMNTSGTATIILGSGANAGNLLINPATNKKILFDTDTLIIDVLANTVEISELTVSGILNTTDIDSTGTITVDATTSIAFNTNDIFIDTVANKIGIQTILPDVELHVDGTVFADSFQSPFGGSGRLQNYLSHSERMDQTWTIPFSATVLSNVAVAPNGETTADTVDWGTSTSSLGIRQSGLGTVIGNTYTVSFWARFVSGSNQTILLDLQDGTGIGVTVDSVFRRYSVTLIAGPGGDFLDVNNAPSGSLFELWGFQLVDGSEPRPYFKTLTSPHVTEDGGTALEGTVFVTSIVSPSDSTLVIESGASLSSGTGGATFILGSGDGLGSGSGGTLAVSAGSGGTTGSGGTLTLGGGSGGSTSGNAGGVFIAVEAATSGDDGLITLSSTVADTSPIVTTTTSGTNGGTTSKFVGSRDPEGNITGAGGDVYIRDNGNLSGSYESKEATTGTGWFKRSVNPVSIVEIHNESDLTSLNVSGVVTVTSNIATVTGNLTLRFKAQIVTDFTFVLVSGSFLQLTGEDSVGVGITYSGTGTLISGTGSFEASGNLQLISTGSDTALTSLTTTDDNDFVSYRASFLIGWNLGSVTGGGFSLHLNILLDIVSGWTLTDNAGISVTSNSQAITSSGTALSGSLFTIATKFNDTVVNFEVLQTKLLSTGSVFDFSTTIDSETRITINSVLAPVGNLFKPSTLTDALVTVVALGNELQESITAMSDNGDSGTTITNAGTFFNGQIVIITGTTSYNGTFTIFNIVAGVSFDIDLDFVANDATGFIDSNLLDITLIVGHGIVAGDDLKIIDSNFYNGFVTALEVVGDVLTVNGVFIVTDTATIERELSLDQTDPRILAERNSSNARSESIAFGHQNANTSLTAITDETYVAVTFSGITINQLDTEGFRLVSGTNYIWEYIRNEPFRGVLSGSISMLKTGSTANYRLAMSTNSVVPNFLTAPYVPIEVKTTQITKPFTFSAILEKGDTIELMVAGDGNSSSLTFTDIIGGAR